MLIRINLLPKEFRPRRTLILLDVKFLLVMILILAAGGLGGYYAWLLRESDDLNDNIVMLRAEQQKLEGVVELQREVSDLEEEVDARAAVVRELTSGGDVRVAMLQHITRVLPENLWLENITESTIGGVVSFDIEGMSYSKEDISVLLAGLQRFEHFSLVNLESITPAPLEIRDAYSFVVNAELRGGDARMAAAQE